MRKQYFYLFVILILLTFGCKDGKPIQPQTDLTIASPTASTLKKATKNYLSAWSDNDTILHQLVTIKNLVRNVNGEIISVNQNELFKTMQFWHRAMPDFKMVEKEINVVGNRTYVNWTGTGTNTGMFGKVPPSGKKGHTEGISILTFDDTGHIVHEAVCFDLLGLMEEWGYTISPPVMK
ncbi:ester cyclase [Maribacter sp. ACAM166]|uniref:ester cyclase n=1 Tax=Maribacter sp. ACAM166 TaxID=2508996 RepID=UPI0010FDA0E2|nr:ester cyclase [Maribacter sp. ACAM166]TLP80242.1 ester cyclase [Maribacter sp. ACAM166]